MTELYLTLLVLVNLRFILHTGILAFPIKRKHRNATYVYTGRILIQYPVMNEPLHLIERFVKSLNTIPEHQRHRFLLQVLDDYTEPLDSSIFVGCPVPYTIVRRTDRSGMDPNYPGKAKSKAGNMNNGLRQVNMGKFKYVAIFDVDHQVEDYGNMCKAADIIESSDDLWCVQSRWVMDNQNNSLVSILQQCIMNPHIDREQTFRCNNDMVAVMNGAGSVMSLHLIRHHFGFWLERAVTEDLDISYELNALGYKVYVNSNWITRIDNAHSWKALREQWSKWAKSNGQLLRYHWNVEQTPLKKWYWLSWMAGFSLSSLKYLFLGVALYEAVNGFNFGRVEQLCMFSHLLAWANASQTWDNKFELRRFLTYPLTYILEFGILDVQVRSFWQGFMAHNKEHEFNPTPKE